MISRYNNNNNSLRHSLSMDPPVYHHHMGHSLTSMRQGCRSRHYSSPFTSNISVAESLADSLLMQSHDEDGEAQPILQEEQAANPVLVQAAAQPSAGAGVNRCHSVPSAAAAAASFDDTIMWPEDDSITSSSKIPSGNNGMVTTAPQMMDPIHQANYNMSSGIRGRFKKRLLTQAAVSSPVPASGSSCMDQDLQTTLDDLRDCDNDFSRFAQELEVTSESAFTDE
jgi:hypothetical protein